MHVYNLFYMFSMCTVDKVNKQNFRRILWDLNYKLVSAKVLLESEWEPML